MDLPYFAPLCGQGLRCTGKGALGATSPNASSPRRAPPSFPFGGTRLCYFPFAPGPSGASSSPSWFASPFRSACLLAVEYLWRRAKVASPTRHRWGGTRRCLRFPVGKSCFETGLEQEAQSGFIFLRQSAIWKLMSLGVFGSTPLHQI